jgi:predicted phosphohydrolase
MILFATSDTHEGVSERGDRANSSLAAHVIQRATSEDVLLLGGDLATDDAHVVRLLNKFRDFPGQKLVVLGNHDVWVSSNETSADRFFRLITLLENEGFHSLDRAPCVMGRLGFAGTMGWYDYSFRDLPEVPIEAYRAKTPPWEAHPVWADAHHANWEHSDETVAAAFAARLDQQLQCLLRQGIERVVVLTHHVPLKRLLFHPRFLMPRAWRFANAFLGSEFYGEVIGKYPNVELVLNGHMHMGSRVYHADRVYASIGGSYSSKELLVINEPQSIRRVLFHG